jgi:hypothetical protein
MTYQPGDIVRSRFLGTRKAVDYVVIKYLSDDVLLVARPSRKHPGDFFGGTKGLPVELIETN